MSLRVIVALIVLVLGSAYSLRRPLFGIAMVIALFHLNLRVFGSGLEDIRFQFYATIVLLVAYFINLRSLDEPPSPLRLPMVLLIGFLGVCFLTSTWAASSTTLAFDSSVDFAKIIVFTFVMTRVVKTEKDFTTLIWVCLAGVFYTAFMTRWGVEWDWISELEIGIATGGTGTHLMLFLPFLFIFGLTGTKWQRIAAVMIIPFVLDAMTLLPEGSRATFMNLVVITGVFLFMAPSVVRRKSYLPILAGAVLFVAVLAPQGYFEYMGTILDPSQESSAASRSVINQASFQMIMDYPQGIGYNNYSLISMAYLPEDVLTEFGTRDAHNSYLKVATEFGILGFLIWISAFISAWLLLRRVRKAYPKEGPPQRLQLFAVATAVGLLGVAPGIATHNYNDLDTLYWFIGFACILYNLYTNRMRQQEEDTLALSPAAAPELVAPLATAAGRQTLSPAAAPERQTK